MSGFFKVYKGAFKPCNEIGIKRWAYFTLKSFVLLIILLVITSALQYLIIIYSPLFEYVTVADVEKTTLYALIFILAVTFVPSVVYLLRIILRKIK
ncbi:hypothetical protein C7G83_01110 [Siccibacter turicensis]|uniref:Uncharacterized protein n=1 Tax=Siccibacter turicensis TaxID=357233 RepID=A0A2P8VP92_9ENTR|nr:hypothetical protein C7G83_01110 [Siccibacter turicensis]